MRALIKTALIAAVGVAVVSASPAFAAKAKRSDTRAPAAYGMAISDWQATLEYLKDAPAHNGNNY